MNKSELIKEMSVKNSLTQKDNEKALKAIIDTIQETLANNEKVQLVGFGTFEARQMAESSGVCKLKGEETHWNKPAYKKPAFKVGKEFKTAVNK